MRVLSNTPEGKLILNPTDIRQLVEDSPQKAAALVVRGRDIIVNTTYSCHNDMMDAVGIVENPYNLKGCNLSEATFRGGIGKSGMTFDIVNMNDCAVVESHIEQLQAAYEFLRSHWKLRHVPSLEIAIFDDDYVRTHTFDANGLSDERQPALSM
jgi:hypothetical protein